MSETPIFLIGRCSFWPEARDPEAWLRALVTLSDVEEAGRPSWTGPRALANTVLRGHLSRRGVPGLFGLDVTHSPHLVLGTGLLEWTTGISIQQGIVPDQTGYNGQATWQLSAAARDLVTTWQNASHRQAVEKLALFLLGHSVWLRLALLKLQSGAWSIPDWDKVKSSNGQFQVGQSLLLGDDADPAAWLCGLEETALGAWWPLLSQDDPVTVQIHAPKTAKPDDGLSLSPLKSPLYLLDSLSWLDSAGRLRLPAALEGSEPFLDSLVRRRPSAAALLDESAAAFADHRGTFPLEPVLLRFAHTLGLFPDPAANDSAFIAWGDKLLAEAMQSGVIELFSSEPGQARHGRGLFGDSQQKLIRWRVHEGFDALCHRISSAFPQPVVNSFS